MRYRGVNEVAITALILDSVLILCLISKEEYKVKHRLFPCRMGYNSRNAYTRTQTHTETDTYKHAMHTYIYTYAFMIQ